MLLDFFQFYTDDGEDENDLLDEEIRGSITQADDNTHTTRDELLRLISKWELTSLKNLFPKSFSSEKRVERSSDDNENISDDDKLELLKYPSFDEVVR